jgi:hypothetical protein
MQPGTASIDGGDVDKRSTIFVPRAAVGGFSESGERFGSLVFLTLSPRKAIIPAIILETGSVIQ